MDEEERLLLNLFKEEERRSKKKQKKREFDDVPLKQLYEAAGLGVYGEWEDSVARELDFNMQQHHQHHRTTTPAKSDHGTVDEPYSKEVILATATPHKSMQGIQMELGRLIGKGSRFSDCLSRRYTLSTEEGGCRLEQLPDDGAGDEVVFTGDDAVSASIGLTEGVQEWVQEWEGGGGRREALQLSLRSVEQMLRELEGGLRFTSKDEEDDPAQSHPQPGAHPHYDDLVTFSTHPSPVGAAVHSLLQALATLPPSTPLVSELLERIHTSLAVATRLLSGTTSPIVCPTDSSLNEILSGLKVGEEREKASGKLEASAQLRVRGLKESEEWLRTTATYEGVDVTPIEEDLEDASENVDSVLERYDEEVRRGEEDVIAGRAEVMAQEGFIKSKTRERAVEVGSVRAKLLKNSRETLETESMISELHAKMRALAAERTVLVRETVEDIGTHAMHHAEHDAAFSNSKRKLNSDEKKLLDLHKMAETVIATRHLQDELKNTYENWRCGVSKIEEKNNKKVKAAIGRVWERYENDTGAWCGIIEKGISAMEGREVMLKKLVRDAEERYDEADRDDAILQMDRVKTRISELTTSLTTYRAQTVELYNVVGSWLDGVPSPTEGVRCYDPSPCSPEEASPGPMSLTPSPMQYEAMKRVRLSDTVRSLPLADPATAESWAECLEKTDVQTIADLLRVRNVPIVWNSFLSDRPLLKSELSLLLERHLKAATEAEGSPERL